VLLYCIVLYCIVLYCIVLYCIVLYYSIYIAFVFSLKKYVWVLAMDKGTARISCCLIIRRLGLRASYEGQPVWVSNCRPKDHWSKPIGNAFTNWAKGSKNSWVFMSIYFAWKINFTMHSNTMHTHIAALWIVTTLPHSILNDDFIIKLI
jgi:hypothetical protein